jgi:hypothetical protein
MSAVETATRNTFEAGFALRVLVVIVQAPERGLKIGASLAGERKQSAGICRTAEIRFALS